MNKGKFNATPIKAFLNNKGAVAAALFSLLILTGCISFKTSYPEISYYQLTQEPLPAKLPRIMDASIQIRDFTIASEYDTDQLIARRGDSRVQIYYYFRWITNASQIVTDFIINRFTGYGTFSKGIIGTSSMIIPDYILEGSVNEMIAVNSESEEKGANYVQVTIRANLLKKPVGKIEQGIVLSRVYTSRVGRQSSYADNIASAYSKAFSEITDKMITDIISIINQKEN